METLFRILNNTLELNDAIDSYQSWNNTSSKILEDENGRYMIETTTKEKPCDCHPETCCHFDGKTLVTSNRKIYLSDDVNTNNISIEEEIAEEILQVIKEHWIVLVGEENFPKLNLDKNGYSDWKCKKLILNYNQKNGDTLLQNRLKISKSPLVSSKIVYRPKTLKGLEDNNGWIKIRSEKDLPNVDFMERGHKFHLDLCWGMRLDRFKDIIKITDLAGGNYSHWKPITMENRNLY